MIYDLSKLLLFIVLESGIIKQCSYFNIQEMKEECFQTQLHVCRTGQ
jgi:hypothetical protein